MMRGVEYQRGHLASKHAMTRIAWAASALFAVAIGYELRGLVDGRAIDWVLLASSVFGAILIFGIARSQHRRT